MVDDVKFYSAACSAFAPGAGPVFDCQVASFAL